MTNTPQEKRANNQNLADTDLHLLNVLLSHETLFYPKACTKGS